MALQSVSFSKPGVDPGRNQFDRQRRIAEALQAQAFAPEQTQMAGGYAIPQGILSPVSKIAQAWAAKSMGERADRGEQDYAREQSARRAEAIARAMQAGQAAPAQPAQDMGQDALTGEAMGVPAVPARGPDPQAIYRALAGTEFPELQQAGMAGMLSQMAPKDPVKMRPGESLVDPRTGAVQSTVPQQPNWTRMELPDGKGGTRVGVVNMNDPNPLSTFTEGGAQGPKAEIAPSGVAYNPYAVQPGQVFNDPNKLMQLGTDGQPVVNRPLVGVKQEIAKAGANSQNVVVNTEKNLFGDMAGAVGKDIAGGAGQARAAVSTINTVNQIRDAVNSGKIIAGPGTTLRQYAGQLGQVLGVAGKDATEQLVQTRKAIQGLAQLELDAAQQMKGQGQITEAERSIIRRAASGDIDSISVPELKMLMDTMEKTSRYKISQNQRNVELLRQQPGAGPLPQFMDVPAPQPYQPPSNVPPPPPGFQMQPPGR